MKHTNKHGCPTWEGSQCNCGLAKGKSMTELFSAPEVDLMEGLEDDLFDGLEDDLLGGLEDDNLLSGLDDEIFEPPQINILEPNLYIPEVKRLKRGGQNPITSNDEVVHADWSAFETFKYWLKHYNEKKCPLTKKLAYLSVAHMRVNARVMIVCYQDRGIEGFVGKATEDGNLVSLTFKLPSTLQHLNNHPIKSLVSAWFDVKTGKVLSLNAPFSLKT